MSDLDSKAENTNAATSSSAAEVAMKSKSDRTPTPWVIGTNRMRMNAPGEAKSHIITISEGDDDPSILHHTIVHLDFGYGGKYDDANAAFIVQAVNSHEALKAVCINMVSAFNNRGETTNLSVWNERMKRAIADIEAALKGIQP